MSSDADAHKVGLIPVTLMVSGNIMGSGVFLLPANLAATGGIAIYGWLVTIIGALALSMVYAKMSSLDPSPGGSYAYARRCFGPFLGYQTNVLYWLACWIGNIAMVVIGVGYLSYFFPILKDPLVLTLTCVAVLWIFVLLNIVGPKMITRVQAVATVLALVPIVGIAVFGWFWFKGETYMAAWNVSGMNTFGAIQSTLNVTLWSFIGVESASVAAGVVRGDATLLRMLLRNLVENAHRYSPEGTHITIHISADPDAIMAVEDEGPGIDESKCGKLSEAFVRMDSRYGGIGLGLSIVSRITQLHQGQFFLQNRTERTGTRAWVLLKKA
ncbi:TPA: amino acid permease [Salmonella enterica subsp. enterica serovar Mbandaka]